MSDEKKYYEYDHLVTFADTNSAGNVYFAQYFHWMGVCREKIIAEYFPELSEGFTQGYGFSTEYAHIDYKHECFLFDHILIRMSVKDLSKTRIEFEYDFVRQKDNLLVAQGRQAVVWVNPQHRPCFMPDKLYENAKEYFQK